MPCQPHNREDLEQIVEAMSDGVVAIDRDGAILFPNSGLTQSLGWTEDDLAGAPFDRFFCAIPRHSASTSAEVRRKDGTKTEVVVSRLNDHLFLIRDLESENYSGRWWQLISDAVAGKTGEEFYSSLVIQLTKALAVDLAFVAETMTTPPGRAHTIGFCLDGRIVENVCYRLLNTPCEDVAGGEFCWYEKDAARLFPEDKMLQREGFESYVGTPLFGRDGLSLGLLVMMSRRAFRRNPSVEAILTIFAHRVSTELERERAEAALRDSEAMYRVVTDAATDGIVSLDEKGVIVFANRAVERIFGRPAGELIGQNLTVLIPDESRERHSAAFERYVRTGEKTIRWDTVRLPGLRGDGREVLLEVSFGESRVAAARRFTGIVRDVTERTDREQALRAKTRRLELINSVLGDLDARQPVDVIVERVVHRLHRAFGKYRAAYGTLDRYGQLTIIASAEPEGMPSLRGATADLSVAPEYVGALRSGAPVVTEDSEIDGRVASLATVFRGGGTRALLDVGIRLSEDLVGLVCFDSPKPRRWSSDEVETLAEIAKLLGMAIHDSEVEADRRRSEERYRSVFNGVREVIFQTSADGCLSLLNPIWFEVSGVLRSDALDQPLLQFVHEGDRPRVVEMLEALRWGDMSRQFECRIAGNGSHTRWVELHCRSIRSRSGDFEGVAGTMVDITHRKESELALVEAKTYLDNLIATSNVMIVELDMNGVVRVYSDTAERITGYSREELIGKNLIETIVPRHRYPGVWNEFQKLLRSGFPEAFENPILTSDGRERIISWRNSLVRRGGIVVGTLSFGMDVTEQRLAEAAQAEAERGYRRLVESVHAIVWRGVAGTPHFSFVSKEAESILGYPVEEWTSDPHFWVNRMHPHDRDWLAAERTAGTTRGGSHEFEYRMIAADGRVVWLRDVVHVLEDGQAFGVMIDVSERKKQEEQHAILEDGIRKAALEWRMTFDAVQTPIIVTDNSGVVLRANRAAVELTGKTYEMLLGRPIDTVGTGEPWCTATVLARQVAELGVATATDCEDRSGRIWQVTVSRVAPPGEDPPRIIVVLWDTTRIVELQASLRRSEAMSAMGSLVAGVAHEVRNPLFGISATIDLFEATTGTEYAEYATVLRRELDRLTRLMNDLLDYGKPQSHEIAPADISLIVADARAACRLQAESARVDIRIESEPSLPAVNGDTQQLRRVFVNLIENALQHSPAGSEVRIVVRRKTCHGRVWIMSEVADSGRGFRAEYLDQVFQPFFSRRKGGTGLGLSIVKRIVEEHAGYATVANGPSGGAVVTVFIPCHRRPA